MANDFPTRVTLLGRIVDLHDENSWEDFVNYYQKYIYLVIREMKINHHDAEELTQEVLVRLWHKLPDFEFNPERGKFRTWLCTIIRNMVRDFVRKGKNYCKRLDAVSKRAKLDYYSSITLPEIDQIANTEWKKYISMMAWENVSKHLSDKVCQVFLLLKEGKKRSEVAKELDLNENSISTYKSRIIDKLSREIQRLDEELNEI